MKKVIFLTFFLVQSLFGGACDLLVFSYDRPMQLYAFLESLYNCASNFREIAVLYRCSYQDYRDAYEVVFQAFPKVIKIEQQNPPNDFKALLLKELFRADAGDYIAFAVDDIIVTGEIDFDECVQSLEMTNAYGFYLRLGRNIDDPWSANEVHKLPPLTLVSDQIYSWQFKKGFGNWGYQNTLDMTIYKKDGLEDHLRAAEFFNPNTLEDNLGKKNRELLGLCYETSRIINLPLNIVSDISATQHLNLSVKELLWKFNSGYKLDTARLFHYKNRSTHVFNYYPSFKRLN